MELPCVKGTAPPNPSIEDLRRLYVEKLGVTEDLVVEEKEGSVIFTFKGLTLTDFMDAIMREGLEPAVCPLTFILLKACENMSSGRLSIKRIEAVDK